MRKSLITAVAAVLVVGASSAFAQTPEPLRLGAFLPVTGPGAFLGAPALATLRLYVDAQNKGRGRPIEFVFYDTGLSAQRAQTAVRRLIDKDQVHAIIGGPTTGASLAVLPIIAERKIPFVSLASASPVLKGASKWVFRPTPSNDHACAQIADHLNARKIKAVVLLTAAGGFGKAIGPRCVDGFEVAGIKVRRQQSIAGDDPEQAKNMEGLKPILPGSAMVVVGLGKDAARIAILRRHLKISAPLFVLPAAVQDSYLRRAKDAAAKTLAPVPPLSMDDPYLPGDARTHLISIFRNGYRARWEASPPGHSGYAYDALHLILGALSGKSKPDPAAIRQGLEKTRAFIGLGGTYHLGPNDHFGLPTNALIMAEVRAGKWRRVD